MVLVHQCPNVKYGKCVHKVVRTNLQGRLADETDASELASETKLRKAGYY